MKYIIPILLIIIIISLFFKNVFIEPLNNCQLADFPEVYGGNVNYLSKSDQKTIILRDFDREDYYKEDEEYIKMALSKKKTTSYAPLDPVSSSVTTTPIQISSSNVPTTTNSSNYTTTYTINSTTPNAFLTTFTPTNENTFTPTTQNTFTPTTQNTFTPTTQNTFTPTSSNYS
jgi:hypothetical protein